MAEGKQHALAIGFTKMSAKDMYVVLVTGIIKEYHVICNIIIFSYGFHTFSYNKSLITDPAICSLISSFSK